MPVIKQKTQFTNRSIGVSSFDTGADAVYRAVSGFANQVGKIAIEEGNKAAEKRGIEKAQALSPEEVVEQSRQKKKGSILPKIQDEAFNRVVDRRFVDTISKDIQLESKRIAQKYEDPVSYERVFGNYLRDMTEGADERFQGVVADVAKYTMADTKLDLASAARAKARAASAQGTLNTNIEFSDEAFNEGVNGNYSKVIKLIEERKTAMKDGIDADLFKAGADSAVVDQIAASGIKGAVNGMLPYVDTIEEQVAITTYVATNGRAVSALISQENLKVLETFKPYMNARTSAPIVAEMNAINTRVNSVRRVQQAALEAELEAQRRAARLAFETSQGGQNLIYGAAGVHASQVTNLAEASASFYSMGVDVEDRISDIDEAYNSGVFELAERNSLVESTIKGALDSQLIAVVSKDPSARAIDSVKAFLANPNDSTYAAITNKSQRYLAKALLNGGDSEQKSGIYTNEFRDYANNFMDDMKNGTQEKIDNEIFKATLTQDVINVSGQFTDGSIDIDLVTSVIEQTEDGLRDGTLSASEHRSYIESINAAQAKGMVNLVSGAAGTTASDLSALTLFIETSGKDKTGLTPEMEAAGNAIMEILTEDQVKNVTRHIRSVREPKAAQEALIQKEKEKSILTLKVANGNGDPTQKDNRETADEILRNQFGLTGITDPKAKNPRVLSILRATPSQELIDGLGLLATGFDTFTDEQANNLMDLFGMLSNDPTDTGVFVNRFGDLLGEDMAVLQEIYSIRKRSDKSSAREIAMTLVERQNDPVSKQRVKDVFGSQAPAEYIASTGMFSEYGMSVGRELGPAAKYFIQIGYSEDAMQKKVRELADGKFSKSDLVIDPRFPIGAQNKTMESLEAMYPNEGRRNHFIERIASELPDGYRLATSKPPETGAAGRKRRREGGEAPEDRLVYLVPSETGARGSYYTYFVDEQNELRPLITERNSEAFWPMFDDSDLETYDMYQAIKGDVDAQKRLSEEERRLEVIREKMPIVKGLFPVAQTGLQGMDDLVETISGTTATSAGRRQ